MSFASDVLLALNRLKTFYNGRTYDPSANAGGMARGGHRVNMLAMVADLSTVAEATANESSAINGVIVEAEGFAQIASDKATIATDKATIATDKATIATDKATIATAQAAIATAQAVIATAQAVIATDKAAAAAASQTDVYNNAVSAGQAKDDSVAAKIVAVAAKNDALYYAGVAQSAIDAAGFVLAHSTNTLSSLSGVKSGTVQTGLNFVVGQSVKLADRAAPDTRWMYATITSYVTGTGAFSATVPDKVGYYSATGSGSDWNIFTSAHPGEQGTIGIQGNPGSNGVDGQVTARQAKRYAMIYGRAR